VNTDVCNVITLMSSS